MKRIQALCFWARKKQKLLQPLVAAEFTLAELQLAADQMREANEEKADAPSIKPKAFTATGWKVWKQSFKTYLSNFKGAQDSWPLHGERSRDGAQHERRRTLPLSEVHGQITACQTALGRKVSVS